MTADRATMVEYGDAGLLVTFPGRSPADRWDAGQALQAALLSGRVGGIVDVVASFESVFVTFDVLRTDHAAVRAAIGAIAAAPAERAAGRDFTLPVVYGGAMGPDLEEVGRQLGLSAAEVIERHTAAPWTIRLRASPAAAPMMDGSGLPGSVSRNPNPRTRLAPGSVAVSGRQCMVYPVASPGGWRVIGRTPIRLFDLAAAELAPYRPGDRIRFRAIDEADWYAWEAVDLAPDVP